MEPLESEGKTVAEAVEAALHKLGVHRDQVEVQILQEPSAGFIGLGARPARVRISEKIWGEKSADGTAPTGRRQKREEPEEEGYEFPPNEKSDFPSGVGAEQQGAEPRGGGRERGEPRRERRPSGRRDERGGGRDRDRDRERRGPARSPSPVANPRGSEAPAEPQAAVKAAQEAYDETLKLMGLDAPGRAEWDEKQERVRVPVSGADAERLVGREGETLESLQLIVALIASRKAGAGVAVQVDAAGYWSKRENDILSKAMRGIDEVKRTGKPFRLEPMDASMRRLIHRNLQDNPDVETVSEGEGSWRKIVIKPRLKR